MVGRLRVIDAGPGVTIQDAGRYGHLRYGVTHAGPMDWAAFGTANVMLGNDHRVAAIEISVGGLQVVCEGGSLWAAFAGGDFSWARDGELLPSAARVGLDPGTVLTARAENSGAFAYLAVEGGLQTPPVMGSRATHVRSKIGGLEGRMLQSGDVLHAAPMAPGSEARIEALIDAPWLVREHLPFRVVPGPQDDYFSSEALDLFFTSAFTLTAVADRMAYRFDGPEIVAARGYDIVSDGVALGAIQIPGDKKPFVLMADRPPTGGYPKLGVLARADIGWLAQMRPGETCRFKMVSQKDARSALLRLEEEVAAAASCLRPLARRVATKNLFDANLIDGVCNPLTGELARSKF